MLFLLLFVLYFCRFVHKTGSQVSYKDVVIDVNWQSLKQNYPADEGVSKQNYPADKGFSKQKHPADEGFSKQKHPADACVLQALAKDLAVLTASTIKKQ